MPDAMDELFPTGAGAQGEELERNFPCEYCGRIARGYYFESRKMLVVRCSEGHETKTRGVNM